MYTFTLAYPTAEHEAAAQTIVDFFAGQTSVEAMLLTCSCARGKATPDSCLDSAILLAPTCSANRRQALHQAWEGFYSTAPVFQRLQNVGVYSHVDYVNRGLYFQAFQRLHQAFGEFLQALFIARRIYPIAYDKWVKEQIIEILDLPELYPRLPALFEISHFESQMIAHKGVELEQMLESYAAN